MLEKTLESPLDCKEIQPVHPTGNQSGIFIGRTDAEAEIPILWPDSFENTLMLGKIEAGGEGTTVDEMVGCYHQLNGCEFDQAPGDGDGHRSLACCQPQVHQELDMTELLDNSNNNMNE